MTVSAVARSIRSNRRLHILAVVQVEVLVSTEIFLMDEELHQSKQVVAGITIGEVPRWLTPVQQLCHRCSLLA